MARQLARLVTLLAAVLIVLTSGTSIALAGAKPPDPYPKELSHGERIGINKPTGEYCDMDARQERPPDCRAPVDCKDFPAGHDGVHRRRVDRPGGAPEFELRELAHWEQKTDKNLPNYKKTTSISTSASSPTKRPSRAASTRKPPASTRRPHRHPGLGGGQDFRDGRRRPAKRLPRCPGHSVVWVLKQFAEAFNEVSTIKLGKTGIGPIMGITTGLSADHGDVPDAGADGEAGGLPIRAGRWSPRRRPGQVGRDPRACTCFATQIALNWADTLSTALINYTFDGGGSRRRRTRPRRCRSSSARCSRSRRRGRRRSGGRRTDHRQRHRSVRSGLRDHHQHPVHPGDRRSVDRDADAPGRNHDPAGDDADGPGRSMSDSTKEWWPKTRNALIA